MLCLGSTELDSVTSESHLLYLGHAMVQRDQSVSPVYHLYSLRLDPSSSNLSSDSWDCVLVQNAFVLGPKKQRRITYI